MKRKLSRGLLAALLLVAATAGCSKKEKPAPAPGPSIGPAAAKPSTPAPVQKQQSSATVMPGGRLDFSKRNDPFKPYAAAVPATPPAAAKKPVTPSGETLPIQSFEVSQFKVAGIIAGLKENKALLIDPNGKGYVVHQGMVIGNNNGRITRITANGVEVVERIKEGGGRVRNKKTVLTLAKKR